MKFSAKTKAVAAKNTADAFSELFRLSYLLKAAGLRKDFSQAAKVTALIAKQQKKLEDCVLEEAVMNCIEQL
jgi:hypothetical protein